MSSVSVFGLGYVGAVSASCLAQLGHEVIGVDSNPTKVDFIKSAKSPVIERGLDEILARAVGENRLSATTDAAEAVMGSQLSLVCVGTPSAANGSLSLDYIRRVCEEIGGILKEKDDFHVVVIRSTVLPGTIHGVVVPVLEEHSGKTLGEGFGVASNPEFLREGTAVNDFFGPPMTVIGASCDRTAALVEGLYEAIDAPLHQTAVETAELVKYACNAWHAVKVCFANEIGNISKALHIDGHRVMDVFCEDTKLNLSRYYMRPGFAFGGSCLPKDVRALNYKGKTLDLDLPLLGSVMPSNERQIDRAFRMVTSKPGKQIGVLGISFKAGTDDLRESPIVELVERLLGKGYEIKIFDRNVRLASLVGANKEFILERIPHLARLLVPTLEELFTAADTIIIGNADVEEKEFLPLLKSTQHIVDLVRVTGDGEMQAHYDGICW